MVNKRSTGTSSSGRNGRNGGNAYKGVRMRKWGKWVSEIRMPKSRERIWLGSYETAEKAARAYDAGVFCIRGGGGGLYNLNFPHNRPALEMLLFPASSSSTSVLNHCHQNHFTRSQIQLAASKYAHSINDVAAVAPPVLPTDLVVMSSAMPVANTSLINSWRGDGVVALSPSEPPIVEQWNLNNNNSSSVLGCDHFYGQECHAARENHYSPAAAAIEGQGREGMLEDYTASHDTDGGDSGSGNSFYQSTSLDDPYYCWTY